LKELIDEFFDGIIRKSVIPLAGGKAESAPHLTEVLNLDL
jgi:hypothetical protein